MSQLDPLQSNLIFTEVVHALEQRGFNRLDSTDLFCTLVGYFQTQTHKMFDARGLDLALPRASGRIVDLVSACIISLEGKAEVYIGHLACKEGRAEPHEIPNSLPADEFLSHLKAGADVVGIFEQLPRVRISAAHNPFESYKLH